MIAIKRSKILVVDDDLINVAVMEEILAEEYELATAMSGTEAIEKARTFAPELVLLDIMMPGMDGYQTCKALKSDPAHRNLKVILVSAKALLSERLKGYAAGADDYVSKPFDYDELLAKVRVFLRLKSVEEVDQFKTDLLDLLSHEVHTPMTVMLPGTELLLMDVALEEAERNSILRAIYENTRQLRDKFDRIMLLFQFRTNRITLVPTLINLSSLIRDCSSDWQGEDAGKKLEIRVEGPEGLEIQGDFTYLQMLVNSLLENAVKHSPPAGRITVKISREEDWVTFSVSDQGPGISQELLPRLFDEFSVGKLINHSQGLGLSLAINRFIVQALGGTINVISPTGQGSTFTVTVPRATSASPVENVTATASAALR